MRSEYKRLLKDTIGFLETVHKPDVSRLYCVQPDFVNLDSARQSQIKGNETPSLKEEHPSQIGKGDDKDQFGKVAASPNPQNLAARSIASPKPIPPPSKPKVVPLPAMPAAEKPKHPQQTTFLILDKIQKHLPHLRLIPSLPKPVGILGNKNELFFLNLSKAIESRFCKVEWMEENEKDLTRFSLIIGEKKLSVTHQILLEPIQHYQNNPNEKKQLWSQICHYLSQRYS